MQLFISFSAYVHSYSKFAPLFPFILRVHIFVKLKRPKKGLLFSKSLHQRRLDFLQMILRRSKTYDAKGYMFSFWFIGGVHMLLFSLFGLYFHKRQTKNAVGSHSPKKLN